MGARLWRLGQPERLRRGLLTNATRCSFSTSAGDLNTLESLCYSDDDEFSIDWQEAEKLSERGAIGGNIFKGDDGRVYFYMGS